MPMAALRTSRNSSSSSEGKGASRPDTLVGISGIEVEPPTLATETEAPRNSRNSSSSNERKGTSRPDTLVGISGIEVEPPKLAPKTEALRTSRNSSSSKEGKGTSRPGTLVGLAGIEVEPPTPAPKTELHTVRSFILVLTCTFAMIINIANLASVVISLSEIERELHIGEMQLQWLVSGYTLSSGCLLIPLGRVADLYGRKKIFIAGSLWLMVFTLGCGFAHDSVTLNILRGFQGIGGAATVPACLGILAQSFSPHSRARSVAFACFSAGAPLGAILGMALGGILVQKTALTWRTPFFLESGVNFLCLVGGLVSMDADIPSTETDKRIDWIGAFLITSGLVLIVFVLGQGESAPQQWRTGYIVGLLISGVIFIILFLVRQGYLERIHASLPPSDSSREKAPPASSNPQRSVTPVGQIDRSWRTPPPLMKLSIWRRENGRLAAMMLIAFLTWCASITWGFWSQLYYQSFLRLSLLHTFLRVLPSFVFGAICNVIVAAVIFRMPIIYLIVTGTLGASLSCLLLAVIIPSAPYWAFGFPSAIMLGIGPDFVYTAGTLYVASLVEPGEQSLAGGLFQTMTQLGTSVGVTVTTVIFDRVHSHDSRFGLGLDPGLKSYQAALWGGFAFGIVGTLVAIVSLRRAGVVGKTSGRGGSLE